MFVEYSNKAGAATEDAAEAVEVRPAVEPAETTRAQSRNIL